MEFLLKNYLKLLRIIFFIILTLSLTVGSFYLSSVVWVCIKSIYYQNTIFLNDNDFKLVGYGFLIYTLFFGLYVVLQKLNLNFSKIFTYSFYIGSIGGVWFLQSMVTEFMFREQKLQLILGYLFIPLLSLATFLVMKIKKG